MKNIFFLAFILLLAYFQIDCGDKFQSKKIDKSFIVGTWKYVYHIEEEVGRYTKEQWDRIINSDLIITKDSVFFADKIDFISTCGNFDWELEKADGYNVESVLSVDQGGEFKFIDVGIDSTNSTYRINSNCYGDISPGYIKKDTLISFNGGIITFRVKIN